MKLYEVSEMWENFCTMLENGEIPTEAIDETVGIIQEVFTDKANNIACLVKNLSADVDAMKAEEKNLAERRKSKENTVEHLKNYLSINMQNLGFDKLETPQNKISFRKSTAVYIANEEDFKQRHTEYCTKETVIKISKSLIAEKLKEGAEILGAELRENQNIQIK